MGNCCGSKKNGHNDAFDREMNEMEGADMQGSGGSLFNQQKAQSFKWQDDLMEDYIDKHIPEEGKE